MNKVDLVSAKEEGLPSSTLKTQGYELKELEAYIRATGPFVEKRETVRNSSKWRGVVTGLTFRKQSRLLCLLQNRNPQPITRLKREKTETELSREMYPALSPCHTAPAHPVHLLNLGPITRGVSRREVYFYGGCMVFQELAKPLFGKPVASTSPLGK